MNISPKLEKHARRAVHWDRLWNDNYDQMISSGQRWGEPLSRQASGLVKGFGLWVVQMAIVAPTCISTLRFIGTAKEELGATHIDKTVIAPPEIEGEVHSRAFDLLQLPDHQIVRTIQLAKLVVAEAVPQE